MTGLAVAISFLSRFPVRTRYSTTDLARSVPWFPIVGALIGSLAGVAGWWATKKIGALPAAFLAVAIGVMITGALHEDGLADTFDGLGAGGDRETILAVMKDSRVGVFGVTALVLAIGLKASLLTALPADRYVLIAGVAGAVSRASAVTMMKVFPPAASIGLAATLSPALSSPMVALTALIGVGAAASLGWPNAAGALLGWASGLLVALWSWRLIGGVTGDTLGAVVVISELGVLAFG